MRALYSWIEEKAETGLSPAELAERLTMLGMEVEEATKRGGLIPGLEVGEVLECQKIPETDHLQACQVRLASGTAAIVCGAENVRAGIKVLVATPGTVLPGGFKIKKTKIRGHESVGMICSLEELGLEDASVGIWILPDSTPLGPAGPELLGNEDWIYHLALTSNRADCLSINGLAREAACLVKRPFIPVPSKLQEHSEVGQPKIRIEAEDLCGRYASRLIEGVKIGPSPDWLAKRLEACGIRSINNVVDVTNYVLLEWGQPLHAFDFEKIAGGELVVRRARDGETLTTLDDKARQLDSSMLVIADPEKPLALAGIMGGAESEVLPSTTKLLLESAWFDPRATRRTSKTTGLASESSFRFERRVDPQACALALDRAVALILETAGGKAGPLLDLAPRDFEPVEIELDYPFIERLLGFAPSFDRAREILTQLGFELEGNKDRFRVRVPSWRPDIGLPADIAEEIARHYGYDLIPERIYPVKDNEKLLSLADPAKRRLQERLVEWGLTEVLNFNFVLEEDLRVFHLKPEDCVQVLNPMSADQKYLRPSLLPNLLVNLSTNLNRGAKDLALFEVAKTFLKTGEKPHERLSLGVLLYGQARAQDWAETSGRVWDFYDAKGLLAEALPGLGHEKFSLRQLEDPAWHPGRSAEVLSKKKVIGRLGEIHPRVLKALDIPGRVVMMEVDDLTGIRDPEIGWKLNEPSRFPVVYRDLAFVLPEETAGGAVLKTIRASASHLSSLRLLSVWRGEQIGTENKSLAFALEFGCNERTLVDDEIETIIKKIVHQVSEKHDGRLR